MRNHRDRAGLRGFTLVEVLIALVLVTLGAGAVMSALSTGTRALMRVEERSIAEWVALNVLVETRLAERPPATGETTGEATLAERRWRWRQIVSETAVPEVLQIEVIVEPERTTTLPGPRGVSVTVIGSRAALPLDLRPRDFLWDSPPPRGEPL